MPLDQNTLNLLLNLGKGLQSFGSSYSQGNGFGTALGAGASGFTNDMMDKYDAQRLGEMYSPLLKNLNVDLAGQNFRTPEELSSYVKLASDVNQTK
jgi:hypothetical protein